MLVFNAQTQQKPQSNQQPTQQPTQQPNQFSNLNKNFSQPNTIDYYLKNNIKNTNFTNDDDDFNEVIEDNAGSSNVYFNMNFRNRD